ncbi:flagellar motor switch protein FliN [Dactylosporangium aurantiacum]|uniref:Flagellar motor switch protein FliN n=1 Tax=Dactylosporangium aurantiacum TaxID=35754 RepID=A0A9Q9IHT9_9ACTN|nr:flagellar motor switch protein FliN [Dactylosporangium aurantiacum]MDG6102016.1 flagellar motor switch protein FliN [Dactylosporangium aurantiacum]UWZ53644.1 flagellar motor switch protein FliN [Dactylosporangium aurantiacum]
MTIATNEAMLARAEAAAQAAVALLPASSPLSVGAPTQNVDEPAIEGQAVRARFAGTAQGEVAIVVTQDLVEALANSPMGALDLSQAVRPALEAAAATVGPVVVDPGEVLSPADAMGQLAGAGGLLVPLRTDEGTVQAVVALAVAVEVTGAPGGDEPRGERTDRGRPAFDLLHDVEMEVTAELGRTRMSVRELLSLAPGAVIELDRAAGGPADLLVNGRLIARGEVVVIDENFGIRITEIVGPSDRA